MGLWKLLARIIFWDGGSCSFLQMMGGLNDASIVCELGRVAKNRKVTLLDLLLLSGKSSLSQDYVHVAINSKVERTKSFRTIKLDGIVYSNLRHSGLMSIITVRNLAGNFHRRRKERKHFFVHFEMKQSCA